MSRPDGIVLFSGCEESLLFALTCAAMACGWLGIVASRPDSAAVSGRTSGAFGIDSSKGGWNAAREAPGEEGRGAGASGRHADARVDSKAAEGPLPRPQGSGVLAYPS